MKNFIYALFGSTFYVLVGFFCQSSALAVTPDILMSKAIEYGNSSGEMTGKISDDIKVQTHSKEPVFASVKRMSIDSEKCHLYNFTIKQTKIPNRAGVIVGDYVTVSRSKVCPDDRAETPSVVIDCHIGGVSCMPEKSANSRPRP